MTLGFFARQIRRDQYPYFATTVIVGFVVAGVLAPPSATAGGLQSWFAGPSSKPSEAASYQPTRFVIGLQRRTEFQVFSLSKPNRVVVELPSVKISLPRASASNTSGLVRSFRGGRSAPGKSRVVIDVNAAVVVEAARIEKSKTGRGFRLALDIVPIKATRKASKKTDGRAALKTKPYGLGGPSIAQPPLPKRAVHPEELAKNAFKPIIVIDPGHGGRDSGAKKHGTVEKNVVLKFSLKLRDALEATGRYRVKMTRDRDVFISLGARTRFAEKHKANLFIAVHADYARSSARGATIYSLRSSVAKRLKYSARRQVARDVLTKKELSKVRETTGDVSAVRNILADLARREVDMTSARSSMFAQSVIKTMGDTTKLRSHPDKTAGFKVLKTAKFPAVLIELAYVSNRQDARLLRSDKWRTKVSQSIVNAIDNYFSSHRARLPI